ncbi:glycosyltransferase family 4 protein [Mucilaginibacter agri]|uniref:Glycosyltransferase n=1 Tax=Mucilaginibacter agri TaxID=2695265 RepID=A0A966DXH4_9SPHI|nr:glycosyltransferase family 4 protein [Mucilaginibacter agri]NCD72279.1 glycosyltransferase [Mucilaginibacter agri]
MNILVLNWTWYPSGGDWTYVENITNVYRQNGHAIVPFSMKDERNFPSEYSEYFIENINYKTLDKSSLKAGIKAVKKSIYSTEAQQNLEKLLSVVKIDFAHVNVIHHYITPIVLKVLKDKGIPIIWTLHEYTPICPESTFISHGVICERCFGGKFYNCVTHTCKKGSYAASTVAALENYVHKYLNYYKYVDYYVCPSVFTYKKFKQFNFFEEKLVQLYHGYDYSIIDKLPKVMPLGDSERYIVFVGRLEKIKGIQTLIKAMEKLPEIRLKIIGSGTLEKELKTLVSENGLKHVTLLGKKSQHETLEIISKADFLVCPSEWYEVLGFTAVEAMALSKPVVGSAIGALPEMVIDERTGFLFEPGNFEELATKIELLYNNKQLILDMGLNAHTHIHTLINTEKHFEGLKKLIPAL